MSRFFAHGDFAEAPKLTVWPSDLRMVMTSLALFVLASCGPAQGTQISDDMPTVLAIGGCFDSEVESVEEKPGVALSTAEEQARDYLDQVSDERDYPYTVGELRWASFGRVVAGGYTTTGFAIDPNVPVWMMVFEVERESRLSWFTNPSIPNRWTVAYEPREGIVSGHCGGRLRTLGS